MRSKSRLLSASSTSAPLAKGSVRTATISWRMSMRSTLASPSTYITVTGPSGAGITLCTDLGDGEIRVKGLCVGLCQDEGEGPYCLPP